MLRILTILCLLFASPVAAQGKSFTLAAPSELQDTGLLKHILPRFSLKTGIRITVTEDQPVARFGTEGTPVFKQDDTVWHFAKADGPHTDAFLDWLLSDVGRRTIEGYSPTSGPAFSTDLSIKEVVQSTALTGDVALGEKISLSKCGRCHVVSDKNRMNAIGSSPSFALMRSFADWRDRFEGFYVLKPHGAFTQVEEVTEPFPDHLPSPIAPLEVTLDEIDAITAYVGTIPPADLGAPIQSQ